jgi:hypothetical protein
MRRQGSRNIFMCMTLPFSQSQRRKNGQNYNQAHSLSLCLIRVFCNRSSCSYHKRRLVGERPNWNRLNRDGLQRNNQKLHAGRTAELAFSQRLRRILPTKPEPDKQRQLDRGISLLLVQPNKRHHTHLRCLGYRSGNQQLHLRDGCKRKRIQPCLQHVQQRHGSIAEPDPARYCSVSLLGQRQRFAKQHDASTPTGHCWIRRATDGRLRGTEYNPSNYHKLCSDTDPHRNPNSSANVLAYSYNCAHRYPNTIPYSNANRHAFSFTHPANHPSTDCRAVNNATAQPTIKRHLPDSCRSGYRYNHYRSGLDVQEKITSRNNNLKLYFSPKFQPAKIRTVHPNDVGYRPVMSVFFCRFVVRGLGNAHAERG